MPYRNEPKKQYYILLRKPKPQPFKRKTEWKFDLLRKDPTFTKKEEMSETPDVVVKTKKTMVGVNAGNQAVNIGSSVTKENTEHMIFSNQNSERQKKIPKGTEYI